MSQQLASKEKCPRCGKDKLVTDSESGEMFCSKCGFVIVEKLTSFGPESISYDDKPNKSRTGDKATLTRHDQGLTTIISLTNKDATGKPLSASMKKSLSQLRLWDNRSRVNSSDDKNLQHALNELLKIKEKLAISDAISEKAAYIYRKALEKKLIRGRSISALIAASLYAACRESGTPRTLKEVSSALNIRKRDLAVCYRMLLKELDLRMPVVNSVSCIARIASNAGLSEKTKRHAMKILKKAEQNGILAGKDPMGIAASALYLATLKMGENVNQKKIAFAAGVTEVTIRNRCKGLKPLNV